MSFPGPSDDVPMGRSGKMDRLDRMVDEMSSLLKFDRMCWLITGGHGSASLDPENHFHSAVYH